ncbi:hypothetical protein OROGR_027040 [Orobanche gracilis]
MAKNKFNNKIRRKYGHLLVSLLLGVVALVKLSLVSMHHNELLHKKDVAFDKLHPQELNLCDRYRQMLTFGTIVATIAIWLAIMLHVLLCKKENLKEKKEDLKQLEKDIFDVSKDSGHVFAFIVTSELLLANSELANRLDHKTMWNYLLVSVLIGIVGLVKLYLVSMHHNELLHRKEVEFDQRLLGLGRRDRHRRIFTFGTIAAAVAIWLAIMLHVLARAE